jgi:hypothetical protein
VIRAVIAASDPGQLAALFARMFGNDALRRDDDRQTLLLGLSRFDIVTPAALTAMFGAAAPDGAGRASFMAALTLRTRSLDQAFAALLAGGVPVSREAGRIVVPASAAFGATLEFRE